MRKPFFACEDSKVIQQKKMCFIRPLNLQGYDRKDKY